MTRLSRLTLVPGLEFIGTASVTEWPRSAWERPEETELAGSVLQPDHLHDLAVSCEQAGFDALLVPTGSEVADGLVVADQVLSVTTRLGVTLALDPGSVAPAVAARQVATLSALHPGRVTLHVVTGDDPGGDGHEADTSDPARDYRRAGEFVRLLERTWRSESPFSFAGEFFEVVDAWSSVRPDGGRIPISIGGRSVGATELGVRHADIFALGEEPLDGIAARIAGLRASAGAAGRDLSRFSVSLKVVVGDAGAERLQARRQPSDGRVPSAGPLVGTYDEVARSLLAYLDAGVTTVVLRGEGGSREAREHRQIIRLARAGVGRN